MSKYTLAIELRELLIKIRHTKNLTQIEVAERLNKPQSFVSKYENGERRLDIIEFLEVCKALETDPQSVIQLHSKRGIAKDKSILKKWDITEEELTELVDQNPSLRGILLGYIAEKKFQDAFLNHPQIEDILKDDDHNRKRKGDRRILYKGQTFLIEVKSLQTNTIKNLGDDKWIGKTQVDASDSREVTFPDGSKLKTTCLLRHQFDLLAINCFAFGEKWRFAFILNSDIPSNTFKKYTKYQQKHLLPSLVSLEWPLQPPFTYDPFDLLDKLIK